MAANELAAHASLQPPTVVMEPQHVTVLLGGFSPAFGSTAGEQVRPVPRSACPEASLEVVFSIGDAMLSKRQDWSF